MHPDGYVLYRALKQGGSEVLAFGGQRYELQFEGQPLGIYGWLRVTNEEGESIRLGPGWSSESCWNALTTLERGRWGSPIGEWREPSN